MDSTRHRGCEEQHVLARYLTMLFTLLTTTTSGLTQKGGADLTATVGWVQDALTDYYCAMGFDDTEASFGRHCTTIVMSKLQGLLNFVSKALEVYMTRDEATRGSWDEALGAVLDFLNDFRDAHEDGVRKSGWPRWLAQAFVTHHDKVGAKVYHALVLCMTNAYYKDEHALGAVVGFKHDLVQGLRKHPDGLKAVGVRDAGALCVMLSCSNSSKSSNP